MIYMRGCKAKDLVAIVDFIYHGEANIYQEDLDRFLVLAEDFQISGLVGAQNESLNSAKDQKKNEKQHKPHTKSFTKLDENFYQPPTHEESDIDTTNNLEDNLMVPVDTSSFTVPLGTNKENLKAQLDSMMVKAEDGEMKWICTVCGKTAKGTNWGNARHHMREHIETPWKDSLFPATNVAKSAGITMT